MSIRVALIGYGLGGRAFHAPLIAATPGLTITTIVTSHPQRKAEASRDFPNARIVDNAEWVWAHARDHDLAVIVTPNRMHAPLTRAALNAGLAVVVDKPFTPTVAEARELVALSRRLGVPLSVYHQRRWDGEILTLRRLLDENALGTVVRFESRLERWRPQPLAGAWRERAEPEEAGGLLYDLGSHLIDQALMLFGPATHVYAEVDCSRPGAVIDDDVFIALEHASGVRSHLWTNAVSAQPAPRLRVLGTRATYTKQYADVQELSLRAGRGPGSPGYGEDPPERWGLLGAGDDVRPVPTEKGDYQRFYRDTVTWLREGGPPPVNPEDAIATLEIIEAARRSAAERRVIPLG